MESENQIPWLKELLGTYPGGRHGNSETRGLDSDFARSTYVATDLESQLLRDLRARRTRLLILTGNAGDGKTAFLQHLAAALGMREQKSDKRLWRETVQTDTGPFEITLNLDGSAAWQGRSADELLDECLAPYLQGEPAGDQALLLAINDGRLAEWLQARLPDDGEPPPLLQALGDLLASPSADAPSYLRFINLNLRSLVGSGDDSPQAANGEFFDRLIDQLLGGDRAREIWRPCANCSARSRCQAGAMVERLLPAADNASAVAAAMLLRDRLRQAFRAVHLRSEVHITTRELRASLSYILFGTHWCDDLHQETELRPPAWWEQAFDPGTELRQGEVLGQLALLDPALATDPRVDRYLVCHGLVDANPAKPPRYPGMTLASARRRAYFEWSDAQLREISPAPNALGLYHGRDYDLFTRVPAMNSHDLEELKARLCAGIGRLEDLPEGVHSHARRRGKVPLCLRTRTPTETRFWVEKPLDRFSLTADQTGAGAGVPFLHCQLVLSYHRESGPVEQLRMGYGLFATLLELEAGYQLVDMDSDDLFANLDIFTSRLAQDDTDGWMAWHPREPQTWRELRMALVENIRQIQCHVHQLEASP